MILAKSIIGVFLLFILAPYLLGVLWTGFVKESCYKNSIALAYILGFLTMLILYQIPAVPMIVMKQSFSLLTNIWLIELIVVCIISIIINYKKFGSMISKKKEELVEWRKSSWLGKLLTLSAVFLIAIQACFLSYANIYDTDDARYIAEGLDAIRTDNMLLNHPLTGEALTEPIGEMTKDVVSPFSMFQASISYLLDIHPATLCHIILPLFLIPLCYLVYWLLSIQIFGLENQEKRMVFINFICVLMMFGRLSAYWTSAYLLWRIWQGKAILAAIILPFLLWLMQGIMKNMEDKYYYILLLVTTFGACILSPMSAIFPTLIIGIYTLLIWFYSKKAIILVRMGLCCIPMALLIVISQMVGMMR